MATNPTRLAIEGAPGLGKTTKILEYLVEHKVRADIYVPTHKLGREMANKIRKLGGTSRQIRGRTYLNAWKLYNCQRHEFVERLQKKGVNHVGGLLCVSISQDMEIKTCPHYRGCKYVNQYFLDIYPITAVP